MGVNVLLFLVFQIGVEPWRRKRLVKGFEEKVMEALEREGPMKGATLVESPATDQAADSLSSVDAGTVDGQVSSIPSPEPTAPAVIEETPIAGIPEGSPEHTNALVSEPPFPASRLESLRAACRDVFSERKIIVRRVDLTTMALEGFGAGVVLVGLAVALLRLP